MNHMQNNTKTSPGRLPTPSRSQNGLWPARPQTLLLAILILAVALRVALALYLGDSLADARGGTYDQISYDALARRLATGHGFSFQENWWPYARAGQPTSFWSYLYTLYLAAVYTLFGHSPLMARLIQSVIVGILTPALTYRLVAQTFGKQIALLSAAIVALYGYFILYATALMTEAFYIVCLLWLFDVSRRLITCLQAQYPGRSTLNGSSLYCLKNTRLAVELGLAIGVAILLRQVILFFAILLFLYLAWLGRREGNLRASLRSLALTGLVAAVLLSPAIVRNYRTFNRLMLPNTNAGFTFFWGNHPIYGTQFEPVLSPEHGVTYQDLIPQELRHLDEAALDRQLMQRALAFIEEDPVRYLRLSLSRVPIYFLFWPTPDSTLISNAARVFSFGLTLPFMAYGTLLVLFRLWSRLPKPHNSSSNELPSMQTPNLAPARPFLALIFLFILTYTAIHLATWANIRYRLPVDALLIPFAAYGLYDLACRLRILPSGPTIVMPSTAQEESPATQ